MAPPNNGNNGGGNNGGGQTEFTISGTNSADILAGTLEDEILKGKGGNDTLFGGGGDDILEGGNGDDVLIASGGPDLLDGGAGVDLVEYRAASTISQSEIEFGDYYSVLGYVLQISTNGSIITDVDGSDGDTGTDELVDVESAWFTDGDADGDGLEELLEIYLDGQNNAPLAAADYGFTVEDTVVNFSASNLISNDLEFDSDTKEFVSAQDAVNGSLVVGTGGQIAFQPTEHFSGDASFTYTVSDGNGGTDTQIVRISIAAVADAPTLSVNPVSGDEDTAIALDITAALVDTDGSESLVIEIAGVPDGATLSAGSDQGSGVWLLTAAQLAGLTITPQTDSDQDFQLTVTARSTEASNGDEATTSATLDVTINAVADAPTLSVNPASGDEDTAIALDITAALVDTDGSESLVIEIAGVPDGATLSAGSDQGSGVWLLTAAQLAGLTITPPTDSDQDFQLTVTARSTEASNGDEATTSATLDVTINAVADAPTLSVNPASGDEDTAIALDITAALVDTDGSESLVIEIAGVPDGATLSAGSDQGSGVWLLTAAQLAGLTITPPTDSDQDFQLTVTARSTEASNGDEATTSATLDVTINAVADAPVVTISALATGDPNRVPAKLTASDGAAFDLFSETLAIGADGTVVVGAYRDDDSGFESGAVYVYSPNGTGGYVEAKLISSDNAGGDFFGFSTAIGSGGTVIVGASLDGNENGAQSGSAYVYTPDGAGGFIESKLIASDGATADNFGESVAIGEDGTIVVGAYRDDDDGTDSGAVYVYAPDGSGGYVETKLTASDGAAGDRFGISTAIGADGAVVVGASWDDDNGENSGAVYVYTPDGVGGYVETKLTASDGAALDLFGESVAIGGDGTVVAGANLDNNTIGTDSGAVYVYTPDGTGGYVETKLTASDGASNDYFGISAAIGADGTIAVGSYLDDDNGSSSGAVYVYTPDGAGSFIETKLTAFDGAAGDRFGVATAIGADGTIVVGAYLDDDSGSDSGSAYTFVPRGDGIFEGPDGTLYGPDGEVDPGDLPLFEDLPFALPVSLALTDTDGSEFLSSALLSGLPAGFDLTDGTNSANSDGATPIDITTWALDQLTVTPATGYAGSFSVSVEATSEETANGDTSTASDAISITIIAVADAPALSANPASGVEGRAIPLFITAALTDNDGSESLAIEIAGVPDGATLSAGSDQGGGVWLLTAAQLVGLTITPPTNSEQDFQLTVTARSTEASNGDEASTSTALEVTLGAASATFGVVFNGINADDQSGWSVSSAGDFNGDGFDDILIGKLAVNQFSGSDAGETYVIYGGQLFGAEAELAALGQSGGINGFTLKGIDPLDGSGFSVSTAGDINDDGFDDILVGAYRGDPNGIPNAGETYVIYGGQILGGEVDLDNLGQVGGPLGFVINGVGGNYLTGYSVSSAGDVNNDGTDDIIIGAESASVNGIIGSGESYVVFGGQSFGAELALATLGQTGGPDGFAIKGFERFNYSGNSVSSAGDVNGDGIDDILVGAWRAAPDGVSNAGETYVIYGGQSFDGEVELASLGQGGGASGFAIKGTSSGDFAGWSVSSAGDFDGDGIDDILIGARGAGETYLVFGGQSFGAELDLSTLGQVGASRGFVISGGGTSVSGVGDVNGDGFDDILSSAPGASPDNLSFAGESYLVFGGQTLGAELDLSILGQSGGADGFVFKGADKFDNSGRSVSGAGDVDGDGIGDLLIGAHRAVSGAEQFAGETYLVYGGVDVLERFDIADGVDDGEISLANLGLNPDDFDLIV